MARPTRKRDPFRDTQTTTVTVVEQAAVELTYDYSKIAKKDREVVRRSALAIKPRLKRAAEDIFVIGQELKVVKGRLPHGEYTEWLDMEFGLSERMAQRFVNVCDKLGAKSDIMSVLPPTTLYLLAAPSTPDAAVREVEKQLDAGERLSVAYVQRVITDAKKKVIRGPKEGVIVDGEATSSKAIAEGIAPHVAKAKHLDAVLSQAIELLGGDLAEEWTDLFHNGELIRVRNEICQLRSALRESVLKAEGSY